MPSVLPLQTSPNECGAAKVVTIKQFFLKQDKQYQTSYQEEECPPVHTGWGTGTPPGTKMRSDQTR